MKDPNIFWIDRLVDHLKCDQSQIKAPDGTDVWVPVRPPGFAGIGYRLKAAWLVFTGQADALRWRGQ